MGDYRSLLVWRRARNLVKTVYELSARFPQSERFGLISQMREAAISIAANLAEGCGRNTDPEIARFARISLGSAAELECLTILAGDLGYLGFDDQERVCGELAQIKPMLSGLSRYLGREHTRSRLEVPTARPLDRSTDDR